MSRRLTPFAVLLALLTLGAAPASRSPTATSPLVVHEWGTFTSIAGQDGRAAQWLPLDGPPDLPCFVDRLRFNIKSLLKGTVRMETPVLYFYTPSDATVNVTVRFRQGLVTEWFPRAAVTPASADGSSLGRSDFASSIAWTGVKVSPGSTADFPVERAASHYYLARHTDSTPLEVNSQKEKFLFYRGVGGFQPPVSAIVAPDGKVVVTSSSGDAIGDVMLFENRAGVVGYDVRQGSTSRLTFDPPELDGEIVAPLAELEQILMSSGLYEKEARAMIETWRDTWFEEGTRLLYVVSRKALDSILPLEISPAPSEVARVFVGRVELVTSTTEREVEEAIAENDRLTLGKYLRFLPAIADRVLARSTPADRARMRAYMQTVYASWATSPGVCR